MKALRLVVHPLALAWLSLAMAISVPGAKPNILLIVADDLGFSDLGCYGSEIATPNLDKLAGNGVRLTRFYSTGRCCPSRASILTGLYPHRAGVGYMVRNLGQAGYRGRLADDALTIAQVLQPAGYRAFISGKWHVGTPDPTQHGFEEFYGTLSSAQSFWNPNQYVRLPRGRPTRTYPQGAFYGTHALTDYALDFLDEARKTPDKPWFLYLAYNSPHFPLQAPKEDIAKYATTYEAGWDAIRQGRHARMKQLGVIPAATVLSPRSQYWAWGEETGTNPAWDDVPADRRKDLARRMAIYAAMVEVMDRNIGRVMTNLTAHKELENTLVVFVSDNGACAEWNPFGFDTQTGPDNILYRGEDIERMGGPGTYHSVGSGWANASNTPWRLYKHYNHEGGISGPCIVQWPAGLKRRGVLDDRPGHLIDLMPTFIEVAGATYPKRVGERDTAPLAGRSLLPVVQGDPVAERALYFEHGGNRAISEGRWKLAALRNEAAWELYDIQSDRTELNNLASRHPEVVADLDRKWNRWAEENYVTPLPKDLGVPYLRPAR